MDEAREPRRLFCWSGGGLPGLDIHAGIWLALEAAGIRAHAHAGTSAGAVAAAFAALGHPAGCYADTLRRLADADVRRERFAWQVRIPWIDHFLEPAPIWRELKQAFAPEELFSDCEAALSVHATRDADGAHVAFCAGEIVPALMASMAIAGVFPPVEIAGEKFSDGGTTANLPLPQGWEAFSEVWLLIAARPLEYPGRFKSMLSRLLYSVDLMMEDQIADAVNQASALHNRVRVIRPPMRPERGALHFDHDLIDAAQLWTARHLGDWEKKEDAAGR
jgi:predicted acylesterase/phospholipase RssA